MRIAVANEQGKVSPHFGHCEAFEIYTVERQTIVTRQTVVNPGHRPGFLPNYLNDLDVDVLITGGIGEGALRLFKEKKIRVVTGAEGPSEEVVKDYLAGKLDAEVTPCREHGHQHGDQHGHHHGDHCRD